MSEPVKKIFSTLIGTVVLIVVVSVIAEWYNINMYSSQLRSLMKMAAYEATEWFAQETYKSMDSDTGGMVNMPNIYDSSGTLYLKGNVYDTNGLVTSNYSGDDLVAAVYSNLYINNSNFKNWISDIGTKYNSATGNGYAWDNLEILARGLGINSSKYGSMTITSIPSWGASEAELKEYSDILTAATYVSAYYTPLNLGITYLDEDVVNKMYKYNLTSLLYSSNPDSIMTDSTGKMYIAYNGFRVYADEAEITSITYKVYNLYDSAQAQAFENLTGVSAYGLGISSSSGSDERYYICVASIEYTVPVGYNGVTPIKNIFTWIMDYEVEGLDSQTYAAKTGGTWNDSTQTLTSTGTSSSRYSSSGTRNDQATVPTTGELVYYIVR